MNVSKMLSLHLVYKSCRISAKTSREKFTVQQVRKSPTHPPSVILQ